MVTIAPLVPMEPMTIHLRHLMNHWSYKGSNIDTGDNGSNDDNSSNGDYGNDNFNGDIGNIGAIGDNDNP